MSNKTYNLLKFVAMIVLPALASFYMGLAQVWNLPFAEEIPTTITLVDTFLGAVLMISTNQYNKRVDNYDDVKSE